MRDLLTAAGEVALAHVAGPIALWTLAAFAVEVLLRATRAHAALALPLRSALVSALPLMLLAPPLARAFAPDVVRVAAPLAAPTEVWLPAVVVGAAPGASLPLLAAGAVLVLAGLVGAISCLRLVSALHRLRRLRWPDAPASVQRRADDALRAAGVTRPVRVVTGADVPLTFGARRPVIAVPDGLDGEALDLALAHEAAHVRAGDFARHALLSALAAPFAAHPMVGVLVRGAALDRERLADAAVLAARPAARRAYGRLLASYATLTAPRLALGATPGVSSLLHRLTAMTRRPSPARLRAFRLSGRAAAFLLLVAVAIAGAASSARADGAPGPAPTTEPASIPMTLQTPPDAPALPDVDEARTPEPSAVPVEAIVPVTPEIAPPSAPDSVYTTVDEMPEMVGGMEAFAARLVYPDGPRAEGASGLVVVKFVVEATGAVARVEVVRSSGDARLDAAATDAVAAQPFTPGRLDGEAVAVSLVLPVRFALPADVPAER